MPVTCPLCRQLIPPTMPAVPPPDDPRMDVVLQVLAQGPTTARQAAGWIFGGPQPSKADTERTRRWLDRAVSAGKAEATVGTDGPLSTRPLVTYRTLRPATG